MNSSKLKWLLITIFLAVNLFFVFQYKSYSDSLNNYTDKEIKTAVEILNRSGTPIKKEAVPVNKTVEDVLKFEYSEEYTEEIASHIMLDDFASYVLPEGISYSNEKEKILFQNGTEFEYTLKSDKDDYSDLYEKLEDNPMGNGIKKYLRKLSDRLFRQAVTDSFKITLSPVSSYQIGDTVVIKTKQVINSYTIDQSEITAVFVADEIVSIEGEMFYSNNISKLSADSLDPINLLFNISGITDEIVFVEKIYFPVTTDAGALYLTPSYKLTCKNGEHHVWDATSSVQRY